MNDIRISFSHTLLKMAFIFTLWIWQVSFFSLYTLLGSLRLIFPYLLHALSKPLERITFHGLTHPRQNLRYNGRCEV